MGRLGTRTKEHSSLVGWLASYYAVFEPHWQVAMTDARATGSVTWKNETYSFENVPFYAEKNWGGAFPIKWYCWCQCNSFDGFIDKENSLSVTAGGGTQKIPLGQTESKWFQCTTRVFLRGDSLARRYGIAHFPLRLLEHDRETHRRCEAFRGYT